MNHDRMLAGFFVALMLLSSINTLVNDIPRKELQPTHLGWQDLPRMPRAFLWELRNPGRPQPSYTPAPPWFQEPRDMTVGRLPADPTDFEGEVLMGPVQEHTGPGVFPGRRTGQRHHAG